MKCYFCRKKEAVNKGQIATDQTGQDFVLFVQVCEKCTKNLIQSCTEAENAECSHEHIRDAGDGYRCGTCKERFTVVKEIHDIQEV